MNKATNRKFWNEGMAFVLNKLNKLLEKKE